MDSQFGAVVLCGGESSRMGRDKAALPWGAKLTLLQQVVGILEDIVPSRNIVVVARHNQPAPSLPANVVFINESEKSSGSGPLAALAQGLSIAKRRKSAVFACGCDAPLMRPQFIRRLLDLASTDEPAHAIVPADGPRLYPLAAAYRPACSQLLIDAYLAGVRSLHRALQSDSLAVRKISVEQLRCVDPELDSLVNCNTPEEYEGALRKAGLVN